jgi:hypothetical protein
MSGILEWTKSLFGLKNELDDLKEQKLKQIEERKIMLRRLEDIEKSCPSAVNAYRKLHTYIGLKQQEDILKSGFSGMLEVSKKQLETTNRYYANFNRLLNNKRPKICLCLRELIEEDRKIACENEPELNFVITY